MSKPISNISVSNIIWARFHKNSFSFQIKGMDENVHFTISFHENNPYVNLHITKNVLGNQTYKPKITIVKAEKGAVEEILEIAIKAFFSKMFKPIHFNNFSRQARKRMRALFLDNGEVQSDYGFIEKKLTESFHRNSQIKNGKLKVSNQIIQEVAEFSRFKQGQQEILKRLRIVNKNSFKGNELRGWVLFLGAQSMPFISRNNKCYTLKKGIRIEDFLQTFMKPELVSILMNNCRNAISRIKEAKTYADTKPYDIPIILYVQKPTQSATIG